MSDVNDALNQTADFWRQFYARQQRLHEPSPFAEWCLENQLAETDRVLELGCGNGRDSFAFLQSGIPVVAVDCCETIITDNNARLAAQKLAQGRFFALDFARVDQLPETALEGINLVYSRFVLHAVPEALEDKLLDFAHRILPEGGRMLHEFRTLRDPLMQKGEALSENERLTDHYRRFIDAGAFRAKLHSRGWKERFFTESAGLAPFGAEDPVVARIVAEK